MHTSTLHFIMRNTKVLNMITFTSVFFTLLAFGNAKQQIFQLGGNLASGVYYAILHVGPQMKRYHLHLDSGSSLTWIHCDDPGSQPIQDAPHPPYRPPTRNILLKSDPDCPSRYTYNGGINRCDYHLTYMDGASSDGFVVRDIVHLQEPRHNRRLKPHKVPLVFGCGVQYNKAYADERMVFDGILGLGKERSSFPSQLNAHSLTSTSFGHCFSSCTAGETSGFGFFGDGGASQSSNTIVWLPLHHSPSHYVVGPARLSFDGIPHYHMDVSTIYIDTGSTYTAFENDIYHFIYQLVEAGLQQAPLQLIDEGHRYLKVCWQWQGQRISDINMVRRYFMAIKLEFGHGTIEFQPEEYLILEHGNICFGIVNDHTHRNMGVNILGAIAVRDRVVTYDNERNRIGWGARDREHCLWRGSTESVLEIQVLESLSVNATMHHGGTHD